nr:ATP-dependent DNA helicase RecG [Bacteroides caecigallinarum]
MSSGQIIDLSSRDIKFLPGVGPHRAEILEKELGIRSFRDLLYHFPYKYVDRSRIYRISEIDGTMPYIQLKGQILSFETFGEGRQRRLVAHFSDGTGVADLVWFQGIKFVSGKYRCREEYIVFGKPTVFGGRVNIAHPDIDSADGVTLSAMGLRPYYNTTERMKRMNISSGAIEKLVANLFAVIGDDAVEETLSGGIISANGLMPLMEALRNVHFPRNPEVLRRAQYRLKFEELFYIQLNILRFSRERRNRFGGIVFGRVGENFNTFYSEYLPFSLTGAQKRVVREMRRDMGSGRQMNRLLQGDVGSGKTLVALMAMLIATDNGCQACMMAPTEILASQHYETLCRFLDGMSVRVELLTGSVKGKKRETILRDLMAGTVNILVGTHAVIEDTVGFASLGLVIIDEQHRFGVEQRARLWAKNKVLPHVLVMTATPIPRTLAMTLYGDLDVSVIDELPPGRKPVTTVHRFDSTRASMYEFVRGQLRMGRQAYIVYPLIQESEKMDIRNLEDGYATVCEVFPEYRISRVHGKMKPAEKDEEMRRFVQGETQIMVATTVIEVGVNVPNASVMVIENAERFGLSQLHQLRGRVGRGADQSYCILMTGYKLSEETRKRIQIMVDTNDGFEIAEADLKLRGPGDIEGTQQSGVAFDLKIANLARDGQLLQYVREVAERIIDDDPQATGPENAVVWRHLAEIRKRNVDWSAIS